MSSRQSKKLFPEFRFDAIDAVLGDGEDEDKSQPQLAPLSKIHRTQRFGRCVFYDPIDIQNFAEEIKAEGGVRSPVWVRPLAGGAGDELELVAGNRRYLASKLAGYSEIPVLTFNWSDAEAHRAAAIENTHRALTRAEELYSVLNWMPNELGISEEDFIKRLNRMANEAKSKVPRELLGSPEGDAIEALFRQFNRMQWQSFVSKWLPILKWPEDALQALRSGKLSFEKIEAIAKVKDDQSRQALLGAAIEEKITLEEIKRRVKAGVGGVAKDDEPQQGLGTQEQSLKAGVSGVVSQLKKTDLTKLPASKQARLRELTRAIADLLEE